ncbi:PTS sugar transporter subunit IIA [Lacrimispora sp.]|uniref:PTS sugar transporter subunit IIA n=1 Tax=Lacrimispora sp. TaxID=2719234 RepID=UPI00346165C0
MRIEEIFMKEGGFVKLKGNTKGEILEQMTQALYNGGCIQDKDAFMEALYVRELEGTTSVGEEIAIPHGISDTVKKTAFVYGYHEEGIFYDAGDDQKTKYFFGLAIPSDRSGQIELLSELARKIMQPEFKARLENVTSAEDFLKVL